MSTPHYITLPTDAAPQRTEQIGEAVVWVHLSGKMREPLDELAKRFGLHTLAVDDCFSIHQLPKIEQYDTHSFIVLHSLKVLPETTPQRDSHRLTLPVKNVRLNAFIGANFLITHAPDDSPAEWLLNEIDEARVTTPLSIADVLYRLCDRLIDEATPLLDVWEKKISEIEERMLTRTDHRNIDSLFVMRRHLRRVYKIAQLDREIFFRLSHEQIPGMDTHSRIYFRDIHDHLTRLAEYATAHREALSDALEVSLALTAERTNHVMKQLSIAAAVILPMTLITGIFGMNFHWMPWIADTNGFYMSMGLMAVIAIAAFLYFRRQHWL